MQMRKELYNFCVNRDILKKKDEIYTCKNVNDWITEKYNNYISKEKCKKYKGIIDPYLESYSPFHISEFCTFYDIPKEFQDIYCPWYPHKQK